MSDVLVGNLFNEFVDVYQLVTRTRSREKALSVINNGLCGMAAMAVGNMLMHRYGYDKSRVQWRSHCLHMWLRVDGVDYDSLYPQGYDKPVVEEWLLDEVNYNSYEMGGSIDSKEDNDGYQQFHLWYCHVINEVFYARHGVTPPAFQAKNKRDWRKGITNGERKQQRRYNRRGKIAMAAKPRDIIADVMNEGQWVDGIWTTGVYPLTHYSHGEFETDFSRPLKHYGVDLRGCRLAEFIRRHRRLIKDSREKGIPVTRL